MSAETSRAGPSPRPSRPTSRPSPSPTPTAEPTATLPPLPPGEVPILYYHRVEPPPADFADWSLSRRRSFLATNVLPEAFDAQLAWLSQHGYTTILPWDLAAHWDKGKKLPARPIILTFDDGTPDWVSTVLPLLRKHHMVAEFYVAIGHVGRGLTWDDLRTLMKAGNGIGAHDINHTQLAGFADGHAASAERMWNEVKGARDIIGANLGVKPDSMAYVGGGFNATLVDLVRRAGYTTARSIVRGVVQTSDVRYRLRVSRIGAYDDVTNVLKRTLVPGLPTFEKRVTGIDPG
jgi:peptidoglycan/xylan/chitin deacetylase (PgdA/CDA1 family)